MAGVERVSVHVSRLAHCPDVFFVEFSRAGSVGNLVVIPFMTFNLQPEVSRAVSEA